MMKNMNLRFSSCLLCIVSCMGMCADSYPSACANGADGVDNYGYACPNMMMLSDEMIRASEDDFLNDRFVYAVAGGGSDDDCGKCYQVRLLDAEREWRSDFSMLIVQIVNSGFDVIRGQMDIFMGGGGFGYFTACNADCASHYCNGGPCKAPMYDGNFQQWVDAEYNDPNLCYSGGIKWLDKKDPERLCRGLSDNGRDYLANTTTDSCVRTNIGLMHQNFVSTDYTRVQCPFHLTEQTGLSRRDDASFPMPSPTTTLDQQCRGDRQQGRFCITTMQDCCKMSCSWSGKIPTEALDPSRQCIYTCHRNGSIIRGWT